MKLPGCSELQTVINQTNITSMDSMAETLFHNELHPLFGGMWQCEFITFLLSRLCDFVPWPDGQGECVRVSLSYPF